MRRILGILALWVVAAAAGCQSEMGPADYVEGTYSPPAMMPPSTMSQTYLQSDQQGVVQEGGIFVDPSHTQAATGSPTGYSGMTYVPGNSNDSGYSDNSNDVWATPAPDDSGFGGYRHRDRDRNHDYGQD